MTTSNKTTWVTTVIGTTNGCITCCAGVVDSSGIKFYVTKQLRKHHAGIMELGQEYTDKVALPPALPQWNLDGYCTPDCTRVVRPTSSTRIRQ